MILIDFTNAKILTILQLSKKYMIILLKYDFHWGGDIFSLDVDFSSVSTQYGPLFAVIHATSFYLNT